MGKDTSEVRREVEQAREELGATVEALTYKANAPRRMKDRVAARMERLTRRIRTAVQR